LIEFPDPSGFGFEVRPELLWLGIFRFNFHGKDFHQPSVENKSKALQLRWRSVQRE
jgi:hypothetical protein